METHATTILAVRKDGIVALAGGSLLYLGLRPKLDGTGLQGPPLLQDLDGQRAFEHLLARLSSGARSARKLLTTRRLQWQMLWLVGAALLAGALPLWLQWLMGGLCALAAAWQAKFHRLAALTLLGGAGLAWPPALPFYGSPRPIWR